MEKRAIVTEGKTPSEQSGKPSVMIKNGHALAAEEKDTLSRSEASLADAMRTCNTLRHDSTRRTD